MKKLPFKKFVPIGVCILCWLLAMPQLSADELADLKAQLQALQQQMGALQERIQKAIDQNASERPKAQETAVTRLIEKVRPIEQRAFLERKSGEGVTFYTGGRESSAGEMTVYGNLDLSFDVVTKGIGGFLGPDGTPPVGNMGWLPDISTNLSYVGVRGFETVKNMPFRFVYQLETQIDVSATAGTGETNSTESNVVKGALTSRNSFIGVSFPHFGAIKIGKTDAPYKTSTMRLNPFLATIGDYQAIMGNTGGDNRVEFGTRLDHSIWYESPDWRGFNLALLYSPGQNRANNSDNIPAGGSDCTGGNVPGSGGIIPVTCSDGSWSDAVSGSATYTKGPLFLAAAYERHMKVNRSSDITGIYGSGNDYSVQLQAQDIADEDAGKIAGQYLFKSKTSVGGMFETLHRYVPADLQFQNERQRKGTWLIVSQKLPGGTSLSFSWAHAFRAPGDPGQHNDSFVTPPGGVPGTDFTAGANADNRANLFTVGLFRKLNANLTLYSVWAMTMNGPAAHFDLGGGGRAVATDCHDAFAAAGGLVAANPHCWTGGTLDGASIGMKWKF